MQQIAFLRWTGAALLLGGAFTIIVNVALTPLLPADAPFAQIAATSAFLWRQSASALAAAMLLLGCVGLYLRQSDRIGLPGALAFTITFFGTALLLAWEWTDIFVLRDLALRAPAALHTLEAPTTLTPYDLGALIPVSVFAVGWLAFAVVTLRAAVLPRAASALVIAGLFLTPMLSAALGRDWGGAIGSAVLGAGWMWLGVTMQNAVINSSWNSLPE